MFLIKEIDSLLYIVGNIVTLEGAVYATLSQPLFTEKRAVGRTYDRAVARAASHSSSRWGLASSPTQEFRPIPNQIHVGRPCLIVEIPRKHNNLYPEHLSWPDAKISHFKDHHTMMRARAVVRQFKFTLKCLMWMMFASLRQGMRSPAAHLRRQFTKHLPQITSSLCISCHQDLLVVKA